MPETALESIANFVIFNDSINIEVVKLDASFSITSRVAFLKVEYAKILLK